MFCNSFKKVDSIYKILNCLYLKKLSSLSTYPGLLTSNKDICRSLSFSYSTAISSAKWKILSNETKAVSRLLERSGFNRQQQLSILSSSFHSSGGSSPDKNPDDDKDKKNDDRKTLLAKAALWMLTSYIIIAVVSLLVPNNSQPEISRVVSWNEFFYQMLAKGEVEEVIIRPYMNIVTIILHEDAVLKDKKIDNRVFHMSIVDMEQFEAKIRETEESLNVRPDQRIPIVYDRSSDSLGRHLTTVLVALFIVLMLYTAVAGKVSKANLFPMSRAKFTMIDPLLPGSGKGVKFSDVAGSHEAKQEIREFVDFLKNPTKYARLGAKVPKGALLLGPPGCGKTLLAKAVATEGNVPFLAMNGSEFVEMIGGLGAARVRDLFKEAKKRTPCIIYIDEIDAIGRKRSSGATLDAGSQESEQTLNQLLVEMDGIFTKEGVVILASTNRLDILDKALLRPGRFDRHIMMDLPTLIERKEIFDHHLQSIILEKAASFYSRRMASLTLGFSGADIANVVNEAALHAARNAKKIVAAEDLEYAVERVVGGTEKRSQALSPEEKRVVAFHESGHALMGWLLEHTDALLKVTIVPRTNQALGFAQYSPKDQKLYNEIEIFQKMCMALGGRVAESLIFNKITTGAQNDLEKVTKMAYAQVRSFGFSEKVGKVSFPEEENREIGKRFFSQKMAATIDAEASKLIFEAYRATEDILKNNIDKLKLLAESLLQKETLNYEDLEALLGPPPHGPKVLIEPLQFENEINTWKEAGKSVDAES